MSNKILKLTSDIVVSYVSNNPVSAEDLPGLIQQVHSALLSSIEIEAQGSKGAGKPAVPVGKSVFEAYIVCLEDGQHFKSLKRHLRAKYDMSPDDYREKWGLPATYPMVAPEYAKKRSELARQIGLGRRRKKSA